MINLIKGDLKVL